AYFVPGGGTTPTVIIATEGRGIWKITPNFDLPPDNSASHTTAAADNNKFQDQSEYFENKRISSTGGMDFYAYKAPFTGQLSVDLTFNGLRGQLDVQVLDTNNMPIANTLDPASQKLIVDSLNENRIQISVVRGQVYHIRVASANNPNGASLGHTNYYDLSL